MGRILTKEDETRRPHLIEYDRDSPSPRFSTDLIRYIESIQAGFSESELAWIHDYEYFTANDYSKGMVAREIAGIRPQKNGETQYIKRFNDEDYTLMMNLFLEYIPADLPQDLADHCNMPGSRLTMNNGAKFYPVNYHYNIPAWRKQLSESAKFHGTMTARFENGKFLLSDGQKINFSDLVVASLTSQQPYPSYW